MPAVVFLCSRNSFDGEFNFYKSNFCARFPTLSLKSPIILIFRNNSFKNTFGAVVNSPYKKGHT
jgi:hypothetical protein